MKKQNKITKEMLIKGIAKESKINILDVKDCYNTLENIIFNMLSSVDEEQDVCIKLFEGISLEGTYVSEKTKKNNLTGEVNLVESKIKPKFNIIYELFMPTGRKMKSALVMSIIAIIITIFVSMNKCCWYYATVA